MDRPREQTTTVLWRGGDILSTEYCRFTTGAAGQRISGLLVLPVEGRPGHIRYAVEADAAWRTRSASVAVTTSEGERRLLLEADGRGHWSVEGSRAPSLDGCIDVDLGFSPATNTLPLRRLAASGGAPVRISAALVRFPELDVQRSEQEYRRRSPTSWAFRAGDFEADIEVDGELIVRGYGEGLWTAIAASLVPDSGREPG